jgi:hypothetical protein
MRKKNVVLILLLLTACSFTRAQVVKSEKSYLHVNNIPEKEVVKEVARAVDRTPPEIKIVSPEPDTSGIILTATSEINIIGKVTDAGGVSSFILNGELKELSATGIFVARIALVPGKNEITLAALDTSDNLSEKKMIVQYNLPVLSLHEIVERETEYYALIIGIENYLDPSITNLDNPIRDAQNLYDILTTRYTFDKENIMFLKDPKREDIINALDEIADKVTERDNLLIFYAGHGWWDEQADIGYWLPADARKNSKVAWFSNSTLVDYLKQVKSKHTLLIADACFTGTIFKTRSAFPDADKAIQKLYELPSRKAMTSGTLTEVPDRSSFMRYLCEKLKDNRQEYLSSEQLFSSIRIAVINNSDAIPQYGEIRNVGDQGGDFIFIKK